MCKARNQLRLLLPLALSLLLTACGVLPRTQPSAPAPSPAPALRALPPPEHKVAAAVYSFPDRTGQYRTSRAQDSDYSTAVTQGGAAVLLRALQEAGGGRWFTVVERNRLDHVLRERELIREQRQGAVDRSGNPLPPPLPLLSAGVIFEGAIVGYDTNTLTGGVAAALLGIGVRTRYRQDQISVVLRAVNGQSGEVWHSVDVTERIYSVQVQGGVFRFIGTDELLELEAGFTRSEPGLVALRRAVERALEVMIHEGAERGLWAFADPEAVREATALAEQALDAAAHRPAEQLAEPAVWRLQFGVDDDRPEPHQQALAEVVEYAKRFPLARVIVAGHADEAGPAMFNSLLAEDRAWNTAQKLVALGLDPRRLKVTAHGSELPVADNATEAGRALNRRVEIMLTRDEPR